MDKKTLILIILAILSVVIGVYFLKREQTRREKGGNRFTLI
jgi:uncharacterized membrane protein